MIDTGGTRNLSSTGAPTLTLSSWTHIAYVADGGSLQRYVNGVPEGPAVAYNVTLTAHDRITIDRPLAYPPPGFGPWSMNLVALHTAQASETKLEGKWFEAIPPSEVVPQSLHEAQLERRLAGR